jgi:fructose-bisphosphate aldolase, class II
VTSVSMRDVMEPARAAGLGVLAFNVVQLEHAEAIAEGAERAGRAIVLQLSENTAAYHRGLAPLALACLSIAAAAAVPAVVHLDHATSRDLVEEAVDLGIGSVMYDASGLSHRRNVALTHDVTAWCHERDVWVEGELGEVGGKDGAHASGVRTDPEEARAFVSATGVDALAVAVGSSHAMLSQDAVLDDELIGAIAERVAVPLVLHGSSGVPDEGMRSAVAAGMTKINIATRLNSALTGAVRASLDADPSLVDPRRYLGVGREAVAEEVTRLLGLFDLPPGLRTPGPG